MINQVNKFKDVLHTFYKTIKQNVNSYNQQFTSLNRTQKIFAESQVTQILVALTRITQKMLNKNTDAVQSFKQLNERLLQQNREILQHLKLAENKIHELEHQKIKQNKIIQGNKLNNVSNSNTALKNKKNKTINKIGQSNIQKDNKVCIQCIENVKEIQLLKRNLEEAQDFIDKNNKEFIIEVQTYNQKIWKLEQELAQSDRICIELENKIKEDQLLLNRLRTQNFRLENLSRNVKKYFDQELKESRIASQQNKSQKFQYHQMGQGRLKQFLKGKVYQSFHGEINE